MYSSEEDWAGRLQWTARCVLWAGQPNGKARKQAAKCLV